jgi:hypothetical protein
LVVPSVVWSILGGLALRKGDRRLLCEAPEGPFRQKVPVPFSRLGEAWRRLALPLAVVIAFAHLCKGLAKVVSWIGYLPLAASDPLGVQTARSLTENPAAQPSSLLPMDVVSAIAMLLILAGTFFAIRELRLAQHDADRPFRVPILVLALSFFFIVFG